MIVKMNKNNEKLIIMKNSSNPNSILNSLINKDDKSLIVLDDCQEDWNQKEFQKSMFQGRHFKTSIMLIPQKYQSYPNPKNDPILNKFNEEIAQKNSEIDRKYPFGTDSTWL